VLSTSPTLVTPLLGTPTSGNLANCTFPTLNQNTTGTAAGLSATLGIGSGGTGQITANTALNALLPSQATANGKVLSSDGTNTSWATVGAGTVTSVTASTTPVNGLSLSGGTFSTSGTIGITGTLSGVSLTTQVTGTLPVANGGTGVTTSTGSGNVVLSNSPTLVTPALGTPASGNLANCTFPTLNQNTTGSAGSATTAGTATQVGNSVTFNSGGAGGASPITFNGSAAQTISYNTIGAPSAGGAGASGTWNIAISGNAATATSATSATTATSATSATTAGSITGQGALATLNGSQAETRNISGKTGTAKTLSTSAATGGSDGDIWYQY
jgi:hypothetical protein